jgi:hypothetical protein
VVVLKAGVWLIVDTRKVWCKGYLKKVLDGLSMYSCVNNKKLNQLQPTLSKKFDSSLTQLMSEHIFTKKLPLEGKILVKIGDIVNPTTVIGENQPDLPQTYIIILSMLLNRELREKELHEGIQVDIGDVINRESVLFHTDVVVFNIREETLNSDNNKAFTRPLTIDEIESGLLENYTKHTHLGNGVYSIGDNKYLIRSQNIATSPVKGIVERIDYSSGTIILREVQDFTYEPTIVNVADELAVKNEEIILYLKRRIGDLIHEGDLLALRPVPKGSTSEIEDGLATINYIDMLKGKRTINDVIKDELLAYKRVYSPVSGIVKKIDIQTGTITIFYDKKPHYTYAMCYGEVECIKSSHEISLKINAVKLDAKIGFGCDVGGLMGSEIVYRSHVGYEDLISMSNIKGLICNTISYECLKMFIGKDVGVALTGNESLPFTIIILSGFDSISSCNSHDKYSKYNGKHVLLRPTTQIRAGVIRPCVYFNEKDIKSF